MVVYGGVSPEHEVAVITALQVMNALAGAGFSVMPVYISKQGNWFLGDEKYLKPETYKDLSKIERLGKRVILSPWEKSGVPFGELVKKLVNFAVEEFERKQSLVTTFESNILAGFATNGLKGGKKVR